MRPLAERACFSVCLAAGRLLRSARYSRVLPVGGEDGRLVRKQRVFYAAALIRLAAPVMRILGTGVRVLPQREWEQREQRMYRALHGTAIEVEPGGMLVLPRLGGRTLAALLEDRAPAASQRQRGVALAAEALAGLHRLGHTHGDAMAENVLVDLDEGVAHWLDFETVHDASRPAAWRRADDVRALLATCLVRTPAERHAETMRLIFDVYGDETVLPLVTVAFSSVFQRPLAFHLAQAGLSYRSFTGTGRLLRQRAGR